MEIHVDKKECCRIVGGREIEEAAALLAGENEVYMVFDRNAADIADRVAAQTPGLRRSFAFDAFEETKSIQAALSLNSLLLEAGASREALLVAVGGGITTDLTGFSASIYKRGIRYANIPTTLLAQVDAAIGGKTGVNFGDCKNMLGVIAQPQWTFLCPETLLTLPRRDFLSGAAEVIKTFLLGGREDLYTRTVDLLRKMQAAADGARAAADGARDAQDAAQDAQDAAQGTADGARAAADGALGAADGALGAADGAQGTADGARAATDEAQDAQDAAQAADEARAATDGARAAADGARAATDGALGAADGTSWQDLLRDNLAAWQEIITAAAGIKAGVVERDPFERGERRILNLGHTFAHAIESLQLSRPRHGCCHGHGGCHGGADGGENGGHGCHGDGGHSCHDDAPHEGCCHGDGGHSCHEDAPHEGCCHGDGGHSCHEDAPHEGCCHGDGGRKKAPLSHGEAVAVGILMAARLAERLGKAEKGLAKRLETDFAAAGLPTTCPVATERLQEAMEKDKKAADGRIRFILPTTIGQVGEHSLSAAEAIALLAD